MFGHRQTYCRTSFTCWVEQHVVPELFQGSSRRHAQLMFCLRYKLVVGPFGREELQQCYCCAAGQAKPDATLLQSAHSLRFLHH